MNYPAYLALDQTELLQLALNAAAQGDAGAAIAYLKEAVARPDATGIVHYLLGAEYAQSRLYDRAVDEMEAAIALDPALSIARFQLGLMLTCMNEPGRARSVLQPLEQLDGDDPLRAFGGGLVLLLDGRLRDAADALERGIGNNSQNPPLNHDMRRLVDEIGKLLAQDASVGADEVRDKPESESGLHMLLSAYMDNKTS